MSIVVRLILGLTADMHKNEHDDIGHEVAQRVHGIGNHRCTMPHDARHELEDEQHHVHSTTQQRHLVYFLVSLHSFDFSEYSESAEYSEYSE